MLLDLILGLYLIIPGYREQGFTLPRTHATLQASFELTILLQELPKWYDCKHAYPFGKIFCLCARCLLWRKSVDHFFIKLRGKWAACLDIWHKNDYSGCCQVEKNTFSGVALAQLVCFNTSLILQNYNMLLFFH